MTSEVRRYNNDALDAGPSQSLWSCIKNSVRRKKCTCHLVSMGRWLTLHWQKRRTVCKNEALLLVSFFVVVVIYVSSVVISSGLRTISGPSAANLCSVIKKMFLLFC